MTTYSSVSAKIGGGSITPVAAGDSSYNLIQSDGKMWSYCFTVQLNLTSLNRLLDFGAGDASDQAHAKPVEALANFTGDNSMVNLGRICHELILA